MPTYHPTTRPNAAGLSLSTEICQNSSIRPISIGTGEICLKELELGVTRTFKDLLNTG
jgi:hypothetical protein